MSDLLGEKATIVLNHLSSEGKKQTPILIIISIIVGIVQIIEGCYHSKEKSLEIVNNPNPIMRKRLKKAVRKYAGEESRSDWDQIEEGLLAAGESTTLDEWLQICAESGYPFRQTYL